MQLKIPDEECVALANVADVTGEVIVKEVGLDLIVGGRLVMHECPLCHRVVVV